MLIQNPRSKIIRYKALLPVISIRSFLCSVSCVLALSWILDSGSWILTPVLSPSPHKLVQFEDGQEDRHDHEEYRGGHDQDEGRLQDRCQGLD
jgi:hypothetical protein